jgi:DNA-binding MarR family transcriptional regulator
VPRQPIKPLAREIDRDLRAIRHVLRGPLEADVARGGLTGPQQSAMGVLVTSDGMSLKDLSRELGLAHSTVSGIVDRLEKRGLVKRHVNRSDLRFSKIVVTNQVREYVRDTLPTLEVHPLAVALRAATPSERQVILQGVRVLRRLLERPRDRDG